MSSDCDGHVTLDFKLYKVIKYDLLSYLYSFTERIVDLWNCLPACVAESLPVDSFKINLYKFWCSQDVYCNYKATRTGTGNRSTVM